jgi:hypothetical protein
LSSHLAHAGFDESLDPELASLPDPPRRQAAWTLVAMALAAAAALAMVFALRPDAAYALAPATPSNVGDLGAATASSLAPFENRLVRAEAVLAASGGIRYERLSSRDSFRTVPVAGRSDVWVEVRVPAGQDGRWEPPGSFVGRLVRFDAAGPRRRGLASAIERTAGETLPHPAWLLLDGEEPEDARWSLVLAATFLAFAAWHTTAIARMLRRAR